MVNTPTLLIDLVCKPPFLFSPVETTLLLTSEGTHPPDPLGSPGISPKSEDGVGTGVSTRREWMETRGFRIERSLEKEFIVIGGPGAGGQDGMKIV